MLSVKVITTFLICSIVLKIEAQTKIPEGSMDVFEKRIDDLLKLVKEKRLDIFGFMMYMDTDSIPQDVFLITYSLNEYDNNKSLDENFLKAISVPNVTAHEETFITMRWTMPTLLSELKKCTYFKVESDFPPCFNGGKLRVIYGRITYAVQPRQIIPPPTVPMIKIKFQAKEYKFPIIITDEFGHPKFFKSLK